MSQLDVDAVKVTALQVIFDLLLTFGFDTLDASGQPAVDTADKSDTSENDEDGSASEEENDEEAELPKKKKKEKGKAHSQSLIYILTELLNSKVRSLA